MLKKNNDNIIQYESSSLFLQEVKDIFNNENSRTTNLENKATIGLTIIGGLLTIIISNNKIIKFEEININNFNDIALNLAHIIILILLILSIVLSTLKFQNVIKIFDYKKLDTEGFCTENANKKKDLMAMYLTEKYVEIINKNRKINNEKAENLNLAIKYIIIALILYSVDFILVSII